MYSRKSNLYATPRNELHVGNETGESKLATMFTLVIILAVLGGIAYLLVTIM